MAKIVFIFLILSITLHAKKSETSQNELYHQCLQCHVKNKLPDALIYWRYLQKYSTEDAMTKAIMRYMKSPKQENSILNPPFFLHFPMKEALKIDDKLMERNTRAYLKKFDMRKRLTLP